MVCVKCGRSAEEPDRPCSCAPLHYAIHAERGDFVVTGHPVGTVVEGAPDSAQGRAVDSAPDSGGRSYSTVDRVGTFSAELSEPLYRGRSAEAHALKVLVQALRARGDDAILLSRGRDADGEDGLLSVNGRRVPVQHVSLPSEPTLWKALSSSGVAVLHGTSAEAVALLRAALVHKKDRAAQTILVLDAAHLGAIVGPRLVAAYNEAHGDPEQEFSLVEVWIVGPTVRSAFRLGSRPTPPAV